MIKRRQRLEFDKRAFTPDDLFHLIENLGTREALRKYQPQRTHVFVDEGGIVVGVARARHAMSIEESAEASARFPGAAWFIAGPGMYSGAKHLQQRLRECAEALQSSATRGPGAWLQIGGVWQPSIGTKLLKGKKGD